MLVYEQIGNVDDGNQIMKKIVDTCGWETIRSWLELNVWRIISEPTAAITHCPDWLDGEINATLETP